jgi:hypothetical protein
MAGINYYPLNDQPYFVHAPDFEITHRNRKTPGKTGLSRKPDDPGLFKSPGTQQSAKNANSGSKNALTPEVDIRQLRK